MDVASSLVGILPPKKPLFLLPLALPTARRRAASLITRAEPPPAGAKSPTSDEASVSSSSPPPTKWEGGGPTGFGTSADDTKRKRRGKERSSVVRRSPIERLYPAGKEVGQSPPDQPPPSASENAFLLTWLGLGILIFTEGIALAASGFLPEEWDNFLVKYLYPAFTPTVFLFVSGTVAYGVIKYFEGEKMKG